MIVLETDRLILRHWRPADRVPFARLNADPQVMEFLAGPLSRNDSDQLIDRMQGHFRRHGFGPCAAELRANRQFIGLIGLFVPEFKAAFTPCVEIAWRLSAEHWGQGLASEGARAMARYAFEGFGLDELVSMTVPGNIRSRRVMEKLGMTRNPADDFDHPALPDGHPLRRHVLYRLDRAGL